MNMNIADNIGNLMTGISNEISDVEDSIKITHKYYAPNFTRSRK